MGKSPAKWIKTVLLGKKSSKSNYVKGKELKKSPSERGLAHEKPVDITSPLNPPPLNLSTVSGNTAHTTEINESNLTSGNNQPPVAQQDVIAPESRDQIVDSKPSSELSLTSESEKIKEANAATKAQAAFRGYLARRAYKALKGIIRLQALIRGHLVRRQAASTLYCLMGIVKLQALARGLSVRYSGTGIEVQKVCGLVKPLYDKPTDSAGIDMVTKLAIFSTNTFVKKLVAPPTHVMPLRVQYDSADPNSAFEWLQRWSSVHAWVPAPQPKKVPSSKHPRKQTVEAEAARPKNSVRKIRSNIDSSTSVHSSTESERTRRIPKKVSSHVAESVPENPQHELEKVKRSLRKVHSPVVVENSGKPEAVEKKPDHIQGKLEKDVAVPKEVNQPEKLKEEETQALNLEESVQEIVVISEPVEAVESVLEPVKVSETLEAEQVEISNGVHNPVAESELMDEESNGKDEENGVASNGELKYRDDGSTPSEIQKSSSKRASFSSKQDLVEDGGTPQNNTPKVPSYMAATQSAKAKLRGQNSSPRTSQDGNGKSSVTRRHSLPSSANGKSSSSSPRTQRPVHGSGKSGNRVDKSLSSSRDGKPLQAEWRR